MGPITYPAPDPPIGIGSLIQGKGVELEICKKTENLHRAFLYPQPLPQGLALSSGCLGGRVDSRVHVSRKGYRYSLVSWPKARVLGPGLQQRALYA